MVAARKAALGGIDHLNVVLVVMDSTPRALLCAVLPQTCELLRQLNVNRSSSHRAFGLGLFNSLPGSTIANMTPVLSGKIYHADVGTARTHRIYQCVAVQRVWSRVWKGGGGV